YNQIKKLLLNYLSDITSDAITYTLICKNGIVCEIPIRLNEKDFNYYDYQPEHANPVHSYENVLLLPSVIRYTDIYHFINKEDYNELSFMESILDSNIDAIMVFCYHLDQSVSKLTLSFKDKKEMLKYSDKYRELQLITHRIYQNITNEFRYLSEFTISEAYTGKDFHYQSKFSHPLTNRLSEKELKLLWFLYHGFHSAKEIASKLYLSYRTVEDNLNRLMKKLSFKNKYDFLIFVSSQHELIRNLIQKGIEP
ncbi:helix-turn-helix transcriptional regulator, partial [Fangia hongkongensis]